MNQLTFLFAYALTVCLETGALCLMLRKRHGTQSIILNSIIANSITLPFVWFFFPMLGMGWIAQTAVAELFAFIAEAAYYKMAFSKLGWKGALLASLACNLISFGMGLLLM